jgi:Putative zinc-finger
VSCDEVREQLPDFTLGTLSEVEDAAVRRHLRGCSSCRAEAEKLDHGMALFGSAAHEAEPPPELRDRVLRVLSEEWQAHESPPVAAPRPARTAGWRRRFLPVAAVAALVIGLLSWGIASQVQANHSRADATALRDFLDTLGGRDVRVGALAPQPDSPLQGSFVIYDGSEGRGESWVLVLVRAPGYSGEADATLLSDTARAIKLHPIEVEPDGEGWTALFTNSDLSRYNMVSVSAPDGRLLATGKVIHRP